MILTKCKIDMDLSECSLEEVLTLLTISKKKILYCSTAAIETANTLARKFGIEYKVDDSLPWDAWYCKGEYEGIFSPGA